MTEPAQTEPTLPPNTDAQIMAQIDLLGIQTMKTKSLINMLEDKLQRVMRPNISPGMNPADMPQPGTQDVNNAGRSPADILGYRSADLVEIQDTIAGILARLPF